MFQLLKQNISFLRLSQVRENIIFVSNIKGVDVLSGKSCSVYSSFTEIKCIGVSLRYTYIMSPTQGYLKK